MRSKILIGALLATAGSVLQGPLSAGQAAQPGSSGVITLTDTITILAPLIRSARAAAKAGPNKTLSDPASATEVTWSEAKVSYSTDQPCLLTWDETTSTHYSSGRTDSDTERHFVWLPYLEISKVRVMGLKSWTSDDDTDSTVPESSGSSSYSGFIVTTPHSSQVIAIIGLKKTFPNPSGVKTVRKSEKIFFSSQADAESARQLLIHAATLLTDPNNRPTCIVK